MSEFFDKFLSPEMSILMNYEAIKRWILAEKRIFSENFSQIEDSINGSKKGKS